MSGITFVQRLKMHVAWHICDLFDTETETLIAQMASEAGVDRDTVLEFMREVSEEELSEIRELLDEYAGDSEEDDYEQTDSDDDQGTFG